MSKQNVEYERMKDKMIGHKNRRFTQYLSLILSLLFLVTVMPIPVSAFASGTPQVESMRALDYIQAPKTGDKITEEVKEDMETGDAVEIIVYMKDKLDSIAFAEKQLAKHEMSINRYDAGLQVRRDLVLALKDQSHNSQYSLRQLAEQADDQVEEFKSYFIANVAYMKVAPELVEKIAALPEVEKITKNGTYRMEDYTVDDATPQAEDNLWSLEMVKAPEAWGIGIDGTGAVVGLLDSGADYTHPALHNSWRGLAEDGTEDATYSWFDPVAGEPLPVDSDSHGTHVTGIMVGHDEAQDITTGVAPGAKWICARVFDPEGKTTDSKLLSSAEWMLAPGDNPDMAPDVVNNSWGGGNDADLWYSDAMDNYIAAGIVPVFAAGNQRTGEPIPGPGSISNPANYEQVIAVAAVDKDKLRPSFSKRGPSPLTDNWKPDISAPGAGVYSSVPGGKYQNFSGTSMAAPHISGVVALLRSANKSLTVEQIKTMLFQNTEPLTDSNPEASESPNHDYGYGLVDALASTLPVSSGIGTFTGKVLVDGTDTGDPTVEHKQEVFDIYLGADIHVNAYAEDDASLVEVAVMVKPSGQDWKKIPTRQVDGDYKSGNYTATIKPEDMGDTDFQYKITAEDYVGNIVEAGPFKVKLNFGVVPGDYVESFEDKAAPGWTMDPLWEIGSKKADEEPEPVDGDQYIATKIGAKYGSEDEALLVSTPIDMRNTAEASARFFHWYGFGTSSGAQGTIYISNDFGKTLDEYGTFEKQSNGWVSEVIDLSPYANSPTPVYVLFYFTSNGRANDYGWYIDKFSLEGKDTTPPAAPQNLKAEAGLTSIKLTWDFTPAADLEKFDIYRSTEAGSEGEKIGTSTSQYYNDLYKNLDSDTTYYYTVKASDMFGNVSEASEQVSAQQANVNVVMAWDFEADNGNFTLDPVSADQNDWEWGEVAADHGPGGALTGKKVWATGLAEKYGRARDASLISPEVTIPADGSSFLTMNHWYHFQESISGNKIDYGQVKVKAVDSADWINVTPESGKDTPGEGRFGGPAGSANPGPDNWTYDEIDLSAFAGKTVQLSFFYHSNTSVYYEGWFINDLSIVNTPSSTTGSVSIPVSHPAELVRRKTLVEDFSLDIGAVGRKDEAAYTPTEIKLDTVPAINARVSVLETGQSVMSSNRTAVYRMLHKASEEGETFTLKAEAYGYVPELFETGLKDGQTVNHNFLLKKLATGTVKGQVYDRYSREPAANAVVSIVEDPNVAPVTADADGNFTIPDVYIGEYTLHATAENFESGTVEVKVEADAIATVEIPLKRFVGVPGEIGFDDGSAENATALNNIGDGVAMRFTPESFGKLTSASVYFWDETWPKPGGNEMGFAVFVPDGRGFKQIGETKFVDDIVRGDWYTIDLSDLNFTTSEDFYVTTINVNDGNHSPGTGLDKNAPQEAIDRSYFYVDGGFQDFESQDYKYGAMIRCTLLYGADAPVITNLDDVTYTNKDTVDVEGTVTYDKGEVLIYADEEVAQVIKPEEIKDNTFATGIALEQEKTVIKAVLKVGEKETEPSPEKRIIKDQVAPELSVTAPADGDRFNVELVHVKGSVADKYLDALLINGVEVPVEEDGSYDYKLIVEDGENPIEVKAVDKAGNETAQKLTVYVRNGDVVIENMQPAENVILQEGESVEVSFNAPGGGNAHYEVIIPFGMQSLDLNPIAMKEVEPGRYAATWVAGTVEFENAEVRFDYSDAFGNRTNAVAPGKISVVKKDPITRIEGGSRYDTAAKMSQRRYDKADTIILASGEDFPDTLVGGLYSVSINAPILLTKKAELPERTKAEIERLGAKSVKILGGELAITADVEKTLTDELGLEVERIYGNSRFETAVEVSGRSRMAGSTHVYLVFGYKYEDALSIVPFAAQAGDPVLLTAADKLNEATRAALADWNTESITIMGGSLVVSTKIEKELKEAGYLVTREAGGTAYATNISVAEKYYPNATKVVGASGADFADAMISAAFAAKEDRPIILLDPNGLRDDTIKYFRTKPIDEVVLIGGELAIPKAIEYYIRALIQ